VWSDRARRRLARLIAAAPPDVAHFHNFFPLITPAAYVACRGAAVPVVQTLHNFRLLCPAGTFFRSGRVCEDCLARRTAWPALLHACYRDSRAASLAVAAMSRLHRWLGAWRDHVDVYVALSRFAASKFVEGGLPGHKIAIKPNFVEPDPGPREGAGNYALFLGRLSAEKGVETLLAAWRKLGCVPLAIAGDGPLRHLVCGPDGGNRTNGRAFLGRVAHDRVPAVIRQARFAVVPSRWYEMFPLVIAEAFACGVPVVASRIGALAELIDDGCTGLLFEPGNADDLAAKAEWLWNHPEHALRMGRNARARYLSEYTAERNYEALMRIYQRAIRAARDECERAPVEDDPHDAGRAPAVFPPTH
jgi:glycosyltransferase involved in cell wall biosynthesis